MLNEMQPEPADGRRPEKTTMISRKLTRRLEELEARRQVKKPLRVVVLMNRKTGVGVIVLSNGAANPTSIAQLALDILSK